MNKIECYLESLEHFCDRKNYDYSQVENLIIANLITRWKICLSFQYLTYLLTSNLKRKLIEQIESFTVKYLTIFLLAKYNYLVKYGNKELNYVYL